MRQVEAELRQAQKMQAIGQLTGGIAHDFNNLLTAVTGNLELLQSRLTDQRSLALVDAAMRSAWRGAQLTQQLLAYARRQNLSPRSVDVNAVIAGMGELLQRSLGGLVQVETDLVADLWPATSDPTQLELVVLNLAINSRDAMPEGGRLRIATSNVHQAEAARLDALDPGDYVRIAVTDTGTGMSRAVLEHAFEPFFTTKEIGKGSGLGLAQVYGVATQFGGTARLSSEPGVGTLVEVFLPRAAAADETIEAGETHAGEAPTDRGTILLVDDDPDVREIAAFFLREAGYIVREAGSGPQARDILAAGPVSLALVDYAMPTMSGHEFVCPGASDAAEPAGRLPDRRRRQTGHGHASHWRSRPHEALRSRVPAQDRARTGAACNGFDVACALQRQPTLPLRPIGSRAHLAVGKPQPEPRARRHLRHTGQGTAGRVGHDRIAAL